MTRSLFIGATLFATALAAGVPQPAGAFRGGGFGGFHGGGAWHASAGGSLPGTLVASTASGGVYAGGFHGPLSFPLALGSDPNKSAAAGRFSPLGRLGLDA